jgi:hypothetical protein
MEPIFEAVIENELTLSKLLSKSPDLARVRAAKDYLVASIPHWLYVGDTPLHLAAAGLRRGAAEFRRRVESGGASRGHRTSEPITSALSSSFS